MVEIASGILDKIKDVFELYSHPEEDKVEIATLKDYLAHGKSSGSDTNHKQIKDSVDEDY